MNEKINFQTIAALLAEKSGITKKEAESFLKEYFEVISEALIQDKLVKIKNLGNLKLIEVSDRESIDIATGNRVLIPAHYKISFVPDNNLAQMVNEPFSLFEVTELEENEGNEENEENERNEGNEEEDAPLIIEEKQLEPTNQKYKNKKERKIKWESIFFGIALLIIAGLFYYFHTTDKKDTVHLYYSEKAAIDTVKTQIDTIKTQISKIESIVIPDKERTVQKGERLTLIALDEYGHKSFWVYLYLENKDRIKNPNNVPAGLKIKIPPAEKYGINTNDSEAIIKAEALAKEIIR
jgi:nucleoid DNA-binding protein